MKEVPMYKLDEVEGVIRVFISKNFGELITESMTSAFMPNTVLVIGYYPDEDDSCIEVLENVLETDFVVKVFGNESEARQFGGDSYADLGNTINLRFPLGFIDVFKLNDVVEQQNETQKLFHNYDRAKAILRDMVYGNKNDVSN